jgi:hypothetical protein
MVGSNSSSGLLGSPPTVNRASSIRRGTSIVSPAAIAAAIDAKRRQQQARETLSSAAQTIALKQAVLQRMTKKTMNIANVLAKPPEQRAMEELDFLWQWLIRLNLRFIGQLQPDLVRHLCRYFVLMEVEANHNVFTGDARSNSFYIIASGRVGIYVHEHENEEGSDGRRAALAMAIAAQQQAHAAAERAAGAEKTQTDPRSPRTPAHRRKQSSVFFPSNHNNDKHMNGNHSHRRNDGPTSPTSAHSHHRNQSSFGGGHHHHHSHHHGHTHSNGSNGHGSGDHHHKTISAGPASPTTPSITINTIAPSPTNADAIQKQQQHHPHQHHRAPTQSPTNGNRSIAIVATAAPLIHTAPSDVITTTSVSQLPIVPIVPLTVSTGSEAISSVATSATVAETPTGNITKSPGLRLRPAPSPSPLSGLNVPPPIITSSSSVNLQFIAPPSPAPSPGTRSPLASPRNQSGSVWRQAMIAQANKPPPPALIELVELTAGDSFGDVIPYSLPFIPIIYAQLI